MSFTTKLYSLYFKVKFKKFQQGKKCKCSTEQCWTSGLRLRERPLLGGAHLLWRGGNGM